MKWTSCFISVFTLSFLTVCMTPSGSSSAAGEGKERSQPLFNGKDLSGWVAREKERATQWSVVEKVEVGGKKSASLIGSGEAKEGKGVLISKLKDFMGTDLVSEKKFSDFTLSLEFLLPKNGNSGIFLMGLYELQLTDSSGIADDKMQEGDMGGIPFFKKPLCNASGKPGEWQTCEVVFVAPRFDGSGKKTSNAKIVKATINGKVVQENLELPEPTGGGLEEKESGSGPIMLQGKESDVAFRGVEIVGGGQGG